MFRDLRPYVCTYVDCKYGEQLYDSWKDWASHENWAHNKTWHCIKHPKEEFPTFSSFRSHMASIHLQSSAGKPLETVCKTLLSEHILDKPNRPCPLCLFRTDNLEIFQNHLATHLQRIALFALPRSTDADNDSSEVNNAPAGAAPNFVDSRSGDLEPVLWSTESQSHSVGFSPDYQQHEEGLSKQWDRVMVAPLLFFKCYQDIVCIHMLTLLQGEHTSESLQEITESDPGNEPGEEYTIKCRCENPKDNASNTVLCEECDTWQHIHCYYGEVPVPDVLLCQDCRPAGHKLPAPSHLGIASKRISSAADDEKHKKIKKWKKLMR